MSNGDIERGNMAKFTEEFKEFIARGNVMDMAVGIIIGGAFTAIVTSLTTEIINPLITLLTGGNGTDMGALNIAVTDTVSINFGNFIGAIINFLIIALVVFWLIKTINNLSNAAKKASGKDSEAEPEVAAPTCPYCMGEIKEGATRCEHCGGEFAEPAVAGEAAKMKNAVA